MSENHFLNHLARRFPPRPPVAVGIGDDGAVLQLPPDGRLVTVTDLLLDGVHFRLDEIDPALAGRKAVAVNLSDLAAMAADPVAAFVSLAIPRSLSRSRPGWIEQLYNGIEALAREYQFTVAGGDTNAWTGPFAINVCLLGTPMGARIPLRSDARPGDLLYVTGPLGGSLHHGRHLTFSPRFDAIRWLVDNVRVHALMDLSDGLATDLPRMMTASGCGAVIRGASIPVHADVPAGLEADARLTAALSDGEDFELLFSIPADAAEKLKQAPQELTLIQIGEVTENSAILLQNDSGRTRPLPPGGWQHGI
ncbi:MAG: thiamine-phosphate kinase [Planctomycetota bacterium]